MWLSLGDRFVGIWTLDFGIHIERLSALIELKSSLMRLMGGKCHGQRVYINYVKCGAKEVMELGVDCLRPPKAAINLKFPNIKLRLNCSTHTQLIWCDNFMPRSAHINQRTNSMIITFAEGLSIKNCRLATITITRRNLIKYSLNSKQQQHDEE